MTQALRGDASARVARALGTIEGAQGVTADPDQLVAMVVAALS